MERFTAKKVVVLLFPFSDLMQNKFRNTLESSKCFYTSPTTAKYNLFIFSVHLRHGIY